MLIKGHIIHMFLRVPLKQVDPTYTLYEVLPIPTPTPRAKENSLYTVINPGIEFITISTNEQYFISMTQRQVDKCRGGSIKICNGRNITNHLNTRTRNLWDCLPTCCLSFRKKFIPHHYPSRTRWTSGTRWNWMGAKHWNTSFTHKVLDDWIVLHHLQQSSI